MGRLWALRWKMTEWSKNMKDSPQTYSSGLSRPSNNLETGSLLTPWVACSNSWDSSTITELWKSLQNSTRRAIWKYSFSHYSHGIFTFTTVPYSFVFKNSNTIFSSRMRANNQKPYTPREGKLISDINKAWERLEKAEHERLVN